MSNEVLFLDAKLKVERAYHHVLDVEGWIANFIQLNLDCTRIDIDPDSGHVRFQTTNELKFPQPALSSITGDAVHSLRAALDYVGAEILRPFGTDPERSSFPIDINRQSLVGKPHYKEIERCAPDIALIIADLIDRNGCKFVGLNQLDRIDKHRFLITVVSNAQLTIRCIDNENDVPDVPREPCSSYPLVGG